jgi:hypothetical protein
VIGRLIVVGARIMKEFINIFRGTQALLEATPIGKPMKVT